MLFELFFKFVGHFLLIWNLFLVTFRLVIFLSKGYNLLLISRSENKFNNAREELISKYTAIKVQTLAIDFTDKALHIYRKILECLLNLLRYLILIIIMRIINTKLSNGYYSAYYESNGISIPANFTMKLYSQTVDHFMSLALCGETISSSESFC